MPRNWGSEAGVGDRGAFAFTTSPVDCLKLHNESPFYFFSFLFFFFLSLDIWFWTSLLALLDFFFLEIQGGLLSSIFAPHLLFFSLPENVRN